jgi:ProQ/FINO family
VDMDTNRDGDDGDDFLRKLTFPEEGRRHRDRAGAAFGSALLRGDPWYLHAAMTPGAVRIDLDGNPSGAVSAEEADAAAARSASRKRNRRPVSTPVPAPPPPKRIGLADLKREAQARKARKAAAA